MNNFFAPHEGSPPDKQRSVWIFGGKKIYASDIKKKLREVGICEGDIVMIHADTKAFGKVGEIKARKQFYNTIIGAMMSVIGVKGALIVPAYTYSLCRNKIFDIRNTKPKIGALSDAAFEMYRENIICRLGEPIIRSNDPIFSCVGFGNKAGLVLTNLGNVCFGDDSVFGRLYRQNAKLMCFGFEFAVTYMHYVERRYDRKKPLKYRYNKVFRGKTIDEHGKKNRATYTYYVRNLRYCAYDYSAISRKLASLGQLEKTTLGGGEIAVSSAEATYITIFEMLDADKYSLLSSKSRSALIKAHV